MILGAAGWWVSASVEDAMRQQRLTQLTTVLEVEVTALRVWMGEQRINVALIGGDEQLRPLIAELLPLAGKPDAARLLTQAKAQDALRSHLEGPLRLCGYNGFFVVSPAGVVLAAEQDMPVGKTLTGYRKKFFARVSDGGPVGGRRRGDLVGGSRRPHSSRGHRGSHIGADREVRGPEP